MNIQAIQLNTSNDSTLLQSKGAFSSTFLKPIQISFNGAREDYFAQRDREFKEQFNPKPTAFKRQLSRAAKAIGLPVAIYTFFSALNLAFPLLQPAGAAQVAPELRVWVNGANQAVSNFFSPDIHWEPQKKIRIKRKKRKNPHLK